MWLISFMFSLKATNQRNDPHRTPLLLFSLKCLLFGKEVYFCYHLYHKPNMPNIISIRSNQSYVKWLYNWNINGNTNIDIVLKCV